MEEVRWTIKAGKATYAVLLWRDGGLRVDHDSLSATARRDKFRNSIRDKVTEYDPRTGEIRRISPREDKYSADLWISHVVQDRVRQGRGYTVMVEGLDWSEVLSEPEEGVKY